jgi:hypothetical protein
MGGTRPTAVGVDRTLDLAHEADGFAQGNDDFFVMLDVLIGEHPSATVLEPFMADLVYDEMELVICPVNWKY